LAELWHFGVEVAAEVEVA
jgi:hypothetical protein